jgi:CRP-like cAMP-binding protein
MSNGPAGRGRNRLLFQLSPGDRERLSPQLEQVSFKSGHVLFEAHSEIEFIYFPDDCVLSAITTMENGDAIEVGTIGSEGAAGLTAFGMSAYSPHRMIAQISGVGQRAAAEAIQDLSEASPRFHNLLVRHNHAFMTQISQSVACNGLHPILQRCCRWLLMTHDRVGRDELPLTHEFLSYMLGIRRQGVTETLGLLQQKDIIRCERGKIIVADRPGLEGESCECYRIVRHEYQRLLSPI